MKEDELKYLILNIVNNIENVEEKVKIIKEKYYDKKIILNHMSIQKTN